MKKMFKNIAIALCAAMTILTAVGCSDAETNTIVTQNAVSATETNAAEPVSSAPTAAVTAFDETTVDDAAGINAVQDKQNKLQYQAYFKTFDPNKSLSLKRDRGRFHVSDLKTWYFYDFNTSRTIGVGQNGDATRVACQKGIKAVITDNRTLTVSSTKECTDIRIAFENDDVNPEYSVQKNSNGTLSVSADLWDASFPNGLYSITGTVSGSDITVYMFINCGSNNPDDYHFYLCYGEEHYRSEEFNPTARREALASLLDRSGVTPETALNTNYNYPCMANASNNDVQYWIDKSHEILGSNNSSNGVKALLLHDWMTSNLKYDYYKVNVLHIQRYYVGRKLNPNEYVSKNYTGVCLDFSSIYAIMCRENGIPCVVLNNDSHAWNAIYVGGRWYEVDLTIDTNRLVYDEDTNRVTGSRLYCYDGFCMPNVNDEIADTATRFCW